MQDFRFSFNVSVSSREDFVAKVRRGEAYGYDATYAPDHLGGVAPFPLMVAAAEATEHMRVGSLVLNVMFWNTHLLAREISTTDLLTDGRLELGLGSGHMKWEFDEAGIPWESFHARADQLEATIGELTRLFHAEQYEQLAGGNMGRTQPKPVQQAGFKGAGPPLIIGGTGDRILQIAGNYADIIGVAGVYQIKGEPPGTLRLGNAADADERVAFARHHAGERAANVEWQALVQYVEVTDDRRATAERLADQWESELSADEMLETPYMLIGTEAQIAEQIRSSRDRYGFTHFTVHEPFIDTFGPVIERFR